MHEIVSLCWEDLTYEAETEGKLFPVWAKTGRRRKTLLLPIHKHAGRLLIDRCQQSARRRRRAPTGPIFIGPTGEPLTYQWVNRVFRQIAASAGFKRIFRYDLLAAYADHLMATDGLTELDLVDVLGLTRHDQVRRLLEIHRSWRFSQKARER